MSGSIVSPAMRDRVRDLATPVARALGRLGLTPNLLTVIGFLGTCAAAVAAGAQAWLVAGILVLVFGIFDLFDGALARATGRVTRFGSFLDSTLDRAGEVVVYAGIVWACVAADFRQGAFLAATAMAAAVMVSYTRAKAESLGFSSGSGMANVGLAPREVRTAILIVSLVLTAFAGGIAEPLLYQEVIVLPLGLEIDSIRGREFLTLGLGLITVLATITTIQRILSVRSQAKEG